MHDVSWPVAGTRGWLSPPKSEVARGDRAVLRGDGRHPRPRRPPLNRALPIPSKTPCAAPPTHPRCVTPISDRPTAAARRASFPAGVAPAPQPSSGAVGPDFDNAYGDSQLGCTCRRWRRWACSASEYHPVTSNKPRKGRRHLPPLPGGLERGLHSRQQGQNPVRCSPMNSPLLTPEDHEQQRTAAAKRPPRPRAPEPGSPGHSQMTALIAKGCSTSKGSTPQSSTSEAARTQLPPCAVRLAFPRPRRVFRREAPMSAGPVWCAFRAADVPGPERPDRWVTLVLPSSKPHQRNTASGGPD